MATEYLRSLTKQKKRTVGNLNSLKIETVAHGAIAEEDVDNFTAVELGFNEEGERTFKSLTDVTKPTYLVAAPETRYAGESIGEFFNGEGERARIVIFKPQYTRFETSAFDGTPENGKFAHFDPETKKFKIHDGSDEDFVKAYVKLEVVSSEEDLSYTLGQPMVRLEVLSNAPAAAPTAP
ncbi:hypothetical protein [Oceanobacillus oncorhynchi]|uniref:hypothetical protein n=1 Tax=Oceanobacillus oncorhynchi TaxID=545501 RepID=UPI0034D484D9